MQENMFFMPSSDIFVLVRAMNYVNLKRIDLIIFDNIFACKAVNDQI